MMQDQEDEYLNRYSEYWQSFKDSYVNSKKVIKLCKEEKYVFSNSITSMMDIFKESNKTITSEEYLIKLLEYLEFWEKKKADKTNIIFIIQALG